MPEPKVQPYDVVAVALGVAGLATHLDERMVQPPALVRAENVEWNSIGKTNKRSGFVNVASLAGYGLDGGFFDTGLSESHSLLGYGAGVVNVDKNGVAFGFNGSLVSRFNPAQDAGYWAAASGGPFAFGRIDQEAPVTAEGGVIYATDQAVIGDYVCHVWFEANTSTHWVQVKNSFTNTIIQPATALTGIGAVVGGYARVIVVGGKFAIVHNRTATVISVFLISPGFFTDYAVGTSVFDIATTVVAPNNFDCCSNETSTRGVLAFHSTVANGQVNILTFNNAGAVVSASTAAFSAAITLGTFIGVCAENDGVNNRIGVASYFTQGGLAGIRARIYTSTLGVVAAATTIETGITGVLNNIVLTWGGTSSFDAAFTGIYILGGYNSAVSLTDNFCRLSKLSTAAAVTNQGTCFRHLNIVSKWFRYNGLSYVIMSAENANSSINQSLNSYFIMSTDGNAVGAPASAWCTEAFLSRSLGADGVVGSFNRGNALSVALHRGFSCNVQNTSGAIFRLAVTSSDPSFISWFLNDTTIDLGFNNSAVEVNGVLYGTGMQLSTYDGRTTCEQGFHTEGGIVQLVQSNGAGTIANGTYTYAVYPEWVNAKGHTELGTCFGFATITTTGANDTVTVTVRTDAVTSRRAITNGPYRLAVFRTLSTDLTGPRHRISSPDPAPVFSMYNVGVYNSVVADTVTFTDLLPDATIAGNAVDYLSNGELDNIHIGRCSSIALYKNRLCVAGGERRNTIFASKKIVKEPKQKAVAFNDGIFITLPEFGTGDITALAGLDEVLVAFKADSIFYITGDGPDDAGGELSSRFDVPRLVSGDVGAVDQRSIAIIPDGVMFKSSKGIYILKRDMQLEYIGQAVEAYNTQTVTQAIVIPASHQVRFLTDTGSMLVYNYRINAWATWLGACNGDNACLYRGVPTRMMISRQGPTTSILEETLNEYTDNVAYSQIVETAWLKVGNPLQGRQLINGINAMLERIGAHDLRLTVFYDFSTTQAGTKTFADAAGTIKQWHWDLPAPHQMQAIKLRFEDLAAGTSNPATTGGFNLIECALEASRFMGLAELPIASRG